MGPWPGCEPPDHQLIRVSGAQAGSWLKAAVQVPGPAPRGAATLALWNRWWRRWPWLPSPRLR